ncbi:MAG: hypothetical protein ACRD7E_06585, partial [Bryobacteraceae bacterium]
MAAAALLRNPAQAQQAEARRIHFFDDFSRGSGGWLPGFSDYTLQTTPTDRSADVLRLPSEIDSGRSGYYLRGRNTSDDLFMYLKKPVTREQGIVPNQPYELTFYIEFASNAPSGCPGVG